MSERAEPSPIMDGVKPGPKSAQVITCPFTVVVDTREQKGYDFLGLRAGFTRNHPITHIPILRLGLATGDYSILGLPQIAIERKSKEDLYGSVVRRANFIARLERMSRLAYAAVVVEAEFLDLIENPPALSKLHPRSLSRTLIAWSIRYPVRWWFVRGRDAGELLTFRLLERFYLDHHRAISSGANAREG
jgi:ERCC4-type nuclease